MYRINEIDYHSGKEIHITNLIGLEYKYSRGSVALSFLVFLMQIKVYLHIGKLFKTFLKTYILLLHCLYLLENTKCSIDKTKAC